MSAIIKALRKALEADPGNWEARQALVEAHLKDGQTEEAFSLLTHLEVLPEDESSLIAAAMSYAMVGSREDARGIIQQVLDRNPASAEAHVALAKMAHLAGDSQTAMRHYVTATSLRPDVSDRELEGAYGGLLDSIGLRKAGPKPAAPAPAPAPAASVAALPPVAEVVPPSAVPAPEPVAVAVAVAAPESSGEGEGEGESAEAVDAPAEAVSALRSEEAESTASPDAPEEPEAGVSVRVAAEAAGEEAGVEPLPVKAPVPLVNPDLLPERGQPRMAEKVETAPQAVAVDAEAAPESGDDKAPVLLAGDAEIPADDEFANDDLANELRHLKEEVEAKVKSTQARDKMASLTVTVMVHVGVFLLATLVVTSVPMRDVPPQIVASSVPAETVQEIQNETLNKTQIRPTTSAASGPAEELIKVEGLSSVAVASVDAVGVGVSPSLGMDFAPSMSFGDASMSTQSKMMFGQKLEGAGEVLGVILDVSGSMAEYLPMVIREVDKNFKNAPIVYVNHAGMVGNGKDTEIYPIIPEEVLPSWPKEWNKGQISPYWFLWNDLPRKAEQRYVDRLIETFKARPNMFIARGGNNRVGAAADFLAGQKVDSIYIFSDFEDFVDEEVCTELGQKLGRVKKRTFIQPAAAKTDHFAVMVRRVAGRTLGRELPPLTDLLRPGDDAPAPIAVAVKQELPVPEGVQFATPRPVRPVDPKLGYNHNRWWDDNYRERFKDEIKVVEYPNFDIVINGPEARALIYMKTKDGFVQSPVVFGYYSHKPYFEEESGKWYYPRRKWLRNEEEPKFDGNEFTWKMILEDEISFEVIFWFKEDTLTGTYKAQIPPNGESDGAFIFFSVPPIGLERNDLYYSPDFPGGLDLDKLRQVMAHNHATFYLPVQAEERLGVSWSRLGFKKGENVCPYNVLYRTLPEGVREVTIGGRSFGERRLQARTTSNNLLLSTGVWRADIELWEGFQCRLVRPRDRRERIVKTEAISFGIE